MQHEDHPESSSPVNSGRRNFLLSGTAAAVGTAAALGMGTLGVSRSAWAAGSDKPELTEVKIGFIPLTDCAPIAVAAAMGFDKKYGIKITPSKEASWAGVRDKLINGELHGAHILYGMIYGSQLGIGGRALCPGESDLQLDVAGIEVRDHIARSDAISLGHRQVDETPADLRGDVHLCRLDVA